jgi:beta propeller repeat protein
VLGVDDAGHATAFVPGGVVELSDTAIPFGAAVNADYVVWTNAIGELGGGVARTEGASYPDTDLYLWSPGTGTVYDLLTERGQQGFPAVSGDRIVWQDSVFGGDDIFTATIPAGL